MRKWKTIEELADMIYRRGYARQEVRLSADTAMFVGGHLKTVAAKPSRNEIARIICVNSCQDLCFRCMGQANVICNAYGSNIEPSGESPVA